MFVNEQDVRCTYDILADSGRGEWRVERYGNDGQVVHGTGRTLEEACRQFWSRWEQQG